MKAAYAAVAAFLASGCLHTQTLLSTREKVIRSEVQTLALLTPEFGAEATVSRNEITVKAVKLEQCRDRLVEQVEATEVWEKRAPPAHWALFGTGAALLAGGVATLVSGAVLQNNAVVSANGLGDPPAERDIDLGRVLVPSGIGATALGGALLTVDLLNLFTAGKTEKVLPATERTAPKGTKVCNRTPAAGSKVALSDGTTTLDATASATGEATFARGDIERSFWSRWWARKATSAPTVEVSVGGKKVGEVVGADQQRLEQAFNQWRDARQQEEAAQALALSENLLVDARAALRAKRGAEALLKLDECLNRFPSQESCRALRATVAADEARRHAEVARTQFAAKKVWEAQAEVRECLKLDPNSSPCLKLKPSVDAALARLLPHHIKDTALYEEGGGFIAYFSLVNASGEYMAATGTVIVSIAIEYNAYFVNEVPIAKFEVKPTDFKVGTLGLGGFARGALIWQRYLSADELYGRFQLGRAQLKSEENQATLYVKYRFTDPLGNELTGRSVFHPP